MEDSGFEWIIYVIAMLIGVIGMVNKARKQAKQQQAPAQPPQFPWEDEVEEIYPPQPIPVPPSQQQWQNVPPQTARERSFDTQGETMREMVAPEGGRTTKNPAERLPGGSNIEEQADHAIDFDLRKAVIYSEILKPKFNAY